MTQTGQAWCLVIAYCIGDDQRLPTDWEAVIEGAREFLQENQGIIEIDSGMLGEASYVYSIAFPLISSGIFGYPKEEAWRVALTACWEWHDVHGGGMDIRFCVLSNDSLELGHSALTRLEGQC